MKHRSIWPLMNGVAVLIIRLWKAVPLSTGIGLAVIIAVLASISLVELYVIGQLSAFFLSSAPHQSTGLLPIALFVYALSLAATWFARIFRVRLCNRLAGALEVANGAKNASAWLRAFTIEQSQIGVLLVRLAGIVAISSFLSLTFGFGMLLLTLLWLGLGLAVAEPVVRNQFQLRFVDRAMRGIIDERILARIGATERASVYGGAVALALFVLLIGLFTLGVIAVQNAIVLLFAIRLLASTISATAGSLVRLARAYAHCDGYNEALAKRPVADSTLLRASVTHL